MTKYNEIGGKIEGMCTNSAAYDPPPPPPSLIWIWLKMVRFISLYL